MTRIMLAFLAVLFAGLLVIPKAVAEPPDVYKASKTYTMRANTFAITNSATIVTPLVVRSMILTFNAVHPNTFRCTLTRAGYVTVLCNVTYNGQTAIFYLDNEIGLITGDILTFTKTEASAAQLIVTY